MRKLLFKSETVMRCYFTLLLLSSVLSIRAMRWEQGNTSLATVYLFAPGVCAAETQAVRYCKEYTASTGEKVSCDRVIELMQGSTVNSCNFAEIELHKATAPYAFMPYFSLNPLVILIYLASKCGRVILDQRDRKDGIVIHGNSTNGLTVKDFSFILPRVNFGQYNDVKIISQKYDALVNQLSADQKLVLFGVSRGSAAMVNFIATEYAQKSKKQIRAIILESCFDSVRSAIQVGHPWRAAIPGGCWLYHVLLSIIMADYKQDGIAPGNPAIIAKFVEICNEQNIPVLLVTSKKDTRVSLQCTINLFEQLKAAGLKDLYLLELSNSTHLRYTIDNEQDRELYKNVVHAFYERYGLSYNPTAARQGQNMLDACRAGSSLKLFN